MRTLVLYLNELSCAFDGLSRDNIRAHVINTIATIRAIAKHREDTNLRMQCRLADLTLGADHSTLGAILGGGTAAHAGGAAVVVVVVVLIVIRSESQNAMSVSRPDPRRRPLYPWGNPRRWYCCSCRWCCCCCCRRRTHRHQIGISECNVG